MGKRPTAFRLFVYSSSMKLTLLTAAIFLGSEMGSQHSSLAQVKIGEQDIPEEMLQTQIATEANSPLTGLVQSANRYAKEQKQLQATATEVTPRLAPSIYRSVELLRLRKLLKSLLPFF